jgi:hypothetical protein
MPRISASGSGTCADTRATTRSCGCARASRGKTAAERVTALLADPLADRKALLRFYSRPRLESSAARLDWVEPDLEPLP